MDNETKKEVQRLVDEAIRKSYGKKIGDTPTDDLQLVNKKYVSNQISSVFSSVQSGFTLSGSINITGAASVGGALSSGAFTTSANATIAGQASIAGNLKVGGTVSVAGAANFHLTLAVANSLSTGGINVPRTYYGVVASNGVAGSPFPTGWTSSFIGTGAYQVVHNFNSTNYVINATALTFAVIINARNTNDFTLNTADSTGTLQNDSFHFVVHRPS